MLDEFKQAFYRHNNAPAQLIIINVVIFVVLALLSVISSYTPFSAEFDFLHRQFAIPSNFFDFLTRPWTAVTYMFTHSLKDVFHILFNMLILYWFGRLFAEYLGSDKLIALYVLGGLSGAAVFLLTYNTIPALAASNTYMVGASAAINAIVVAAAVLLPNYAFYLLFFGPVKIKYIAAVTVFLSVLGTSLNNLGSPNENIGGNFAHLGGALMGYIYMKQLQAGSNWGMWVTVTLEWIKNLFKPKPKVKVSYRKDQPNYTAKASGDKGYTQAEIDAILDKISAGGYESLTKEEKEKLFNASKNK